MSDLLNVAPTPAGVLTSFAVWTLVLYMIRVIAPAVFKDRGTNLLLGLVVLGCLLAIPAVIVFRIQGEKLLPIDSQDPFTFALCATLLAGYLVAIALVILAVVFGVRQIGGRGALR